MVLKALGYKDISCSTGLGIWGLMHEACGYIKFLTGEMCFEKAGKGPAVRYDSMK